MLDKIKELGKSTMKGPAMLALGGAGIMLPLMIAFARRGMKSQNLIDEANSAIADRRNEEKLRRKFKAQKALRKYINKTQGISADSKVDDMEMVDDGMWRLKLSGTSPKDHQVYWNETDPEYLEFADKLYK